MLFQDYLNRRFIINVFTVSCYPSNTSLLNKSIKFLKKQHVQLFLFMKILVQ